MGHFFGCHNCGQNFQKETENMLKEVTKPYDEVKFLWKSKNKKLKLKLNIYLITLLKLIIALIKDWRVTKQRILHFQKSNFQLLINVHNAIKIQQIQIIKLYLT
jgi:hypothetical protein